MFGLKFLWVTLGVLDLIHFFTLKLAQKNDGELSEDLCFKQYYVAIMVATNIVSLTSNCFKNPIFLAVYTVNIIFLK